MNRSTHTVIGEYNLVSVNGRNLPARVYERESSYQDIVRGTLSLTRDGKVQFVTDSRLNILGIDTLQVDTATGTYRYLDGGITLDLPDRPDVVVQRTGQELTLQFEQMVFTWRRRF